jgi:hypothetical protein
MSTKIQGGDKPIVIGKTNLPEGTAILVSIERKNGSSGENSKVKVSHGEFRAGPFLHKGKVFKPGMYTLKVIVPFAPTQPSLVQTVIGGHGEKLQGSLVKSGSLGKFVRFRSIFRIGSKVSDGKYKMAIQKDKKYRYDCLFENCNDNDVIDQDQSGDIIRSVFDGHWLAVTTSVLAQTYPGWESNPESSPQIRMLYLRDEVQPYVSSISFNPSSEFLLLFH